MSYWYIASPYTHPDPDVRQARYEKALDFAKYLLVDQKLFCYSPVVHTHPMCVKYDMPPGFEFYENFDRVMIGRSHGIIVLNIPGWAESKGIAAELEFCKSINLPTFHSATRWLNYDHTL